MASDRQVDLPPDNDYPPSYDDVGLDVTVWLSACLMLAVVILKLSLKFARLRKWFTDDVFIFLAAVFAIGQSVTVLFQIGAGLGHDLAILSARKFYDFQKTEFASQILYVVATALGKVALAATVDRLSPKTAHKVAARSAIFITTLWALAAVLGNLLQCVDAGQVWLTFSPSCFDQVLFWEIISALDLGIDAMLVSIVVVIMRAVDISIVRKVQIVIGFSTKLVSIPLTIMRIVFLRDAFASLNRTKDSAKGVVVTQLAMNLGLMATCVPYLKARACRMEGRLLHKDMRIRSSKFIPRSGTKLVTTPYEKTRDDLEPPKQDTRPRPPPLRTRHTSVSAARALSVRINSPLTPGKMKITRHMSFWVTEEEAPPGFQEVLSANTDVFPG